MALPPLADDEWLNDITTHLAKSGAALRSDKNDKLSALGQIIPKRLNGMPVEYDINYESPPNEVRGYKMTDLLTTCVYLAPCNTNLGIRTMLAAIDKGFTPEGMAALDAVTSQSGDKYLQRPQSVTPEALVVMPGSNLILRGAVDLRIVDDAVRRGAYVKPHPITNQLDLYRIKQRYSTKVLSQHAQLHPLLRHAKHVLVGSNSESGMAAAMYGKTFSLIDAQKLPARPTYDAIYQALRRTKSKLSVRNRLAALFSHPETGLLCIAHADPVERLAAFAKHYAQFKHGR